MTPENIEQLIQPALKPPASASEQPAERLRESLTPAENSAAIEAGLQEARRRANEIDSGLRTTIPGAEVLARLRSQFTQ